MVQSDKPMSWWLPEMPEIVVIDFTKYKGPVWDEHHPTWVPITANVVTCEDVKKCCKRTSFPLITGYAITIAKSQGMTIGYVRICCNMIEKYFFICLKHRWIEFNHTHVSILNVWVTFGRSIQVNVL